MDKAAGAHNARQSNENQYQLWVLAGGLAMWVRGVGAAMPPRQERRHLSCRDMQTP